MKQVTTSVGFQDPLGNLVSLGKLILDLSQPAEVTSGGGLIAPTRVVLPLTALAKITPTNIWFNDELTPSGTSYHSTLIDSNQNLIADFGQWVIAGASADLSTMVPTSGGASAAGAVLLNPVAQQNINGQTLNLEGAALGFSAAASTTADAFVSRNAAGVVQIGTATNNSSGTLIASTIQTTTLNATTLNANLFAAANGTAGAPSFSFQSTTDRGLFNDTTFGGLGLVSGGAAKAYIHTAGLTIGPNVLGAASAIGGAPDAGISRTAAATFAIGNGVAANATGTLNAAAYQVGGTGMTGSGGGIVRATGPTISGPTITGATTFLGQTLTEVRIQLFTGLSVTSPGAADGQLFNTTLTWTTPFADVNYFVFAQVFGATTGSPVVQEAFAASASTATIVFAQTSAVQATVVGVVLIGFHA